MNKTEKFSGLYICRYVWIVVIVFGLNRSLPEYLGYSLLPPLRNSLLSLPLSYLRIVSRYLSTKVHPLPLFKRNFFLSFYTFLFLCLSISIIRLSFSSILLLSYFP